MITSGLTINDNSAGAFTSAEIKPTDNKPKETGKADNSTNDFNSSIGVSDYQANYTNAGFVFTSLPDNPVQEKSVIPDKSEVKNQINQNFVIIVLTVLVALYFYKGK